MTAVTIMVWAVAVVVAPLGWRVARRRLRTTSPVHERRVKILTNGPAVRAGAAAVVGFLLAEGPAALPVGVAAAVLTVLVDRWHAGRRRSRPPDPATLAATWDLLAACLRSGMSPPAAVRLASDELDHSDCRVVARPLRLVADLLVRGEDAATAWRPARAQPELRELATAVRRSASAGSALAETAERLARESRAAALDTAEADAQRAGVLVAAPLALCFLPAFLLLGVVPVLVGLAADVLSTW
ncbi:type II secretion system protein [Actinoalloteichus sp. AHMU CJ021]|uniref:Type II secretion system (T2SS), protein F n=3 Tax=Actinoalloteichus cyanogriseus TaxID=2893586 RepID=A0ABT1JJL5_ACTCY|nr:type II secretion system F family protein [Actinoalloteichus caeruleus]AUS78585.1 type II secretion system protein [Actinoalloteichus sp. AHMU CJ021]MCP2332709.1 Type II secretion system (T2SS), protein F [Actinoalloteichus caeruleus DSM 43889]